MGGRKAAIDLTALAFNFSGIERYASNITRCLLERDDGIEYTLVFANSVFPGLSPYIDGERVKAVLLDAGVSKLQKLKLFQWDLPRAIKSIGADVNVFPAFMPPILCNDHIVATVHDMGYFDVPSMWKWYVTLYGRIRVRHAIKNAERLIAVSQYSKARALELFHPTCSFEVAYNAIDSHFSKDIGEAAMAQVRRKYHLPAKYILCLSTLEPRKNLQLLVKAYGLLDANERNGHALVLAGRAGWKLDNLLDQCDEETKNSIVMTGFVDDEDLPALYAMAELFCFPSIYEGFGIPPLEALACGCPILVSDIAVFSEVFGRSANYFESNNLDDLTAKLKGLLASPIVPDEAEVEACLSRFDWHKSAEVFARAIKGV